MIQLITSFVLASLFITHVLAGTSEDARKQWYSGRWAMIERAKNTFDEQAVTDLSGILRGVGRDYSNAPEEAVLLFQAARSALKNETGLAGAFRQKLDTSKKKAMAENVRRAKSGAGPYWGSYDNVRSFMFDTLKYLPDPKTVELLGEYLYDDEPTQPPIRKGDYVDSMGPPPNSHLAVESLKALIAKTPIGADRDFHKPGDVDAWRLWFEQVKAGKRTFRFVRDSTEYSLAGTATSGELGRIEMNRKRDENRESAHRQPPTPTPALPAATVKAEPTSRFPIAEILAGAALAAAALWYFLKRRVAG